MTAEKFWNLLAKKLSGEAVAEELNELSKFLESNADWKYKAEILSSLWQQSPPIEDSESQAMFECHLSRMKNTGVEIDTLYLKTIDVDNNLNKKFFAKKWLWLAAAVVATGAILFLGINYLSSAATTDKSSSVTQMSN